MSNHEKSRKHKEMVALLRKQLQNDESLDLTMDQLEGIEQEYNKIADHDEEEEEARPIRKLSRKQKKKKRQQKAANSTAVEEGEEVQEQTSPTDGRGFSEDDPENLPDEVPGDVPKESASPVEGEMEDPLPPAEPKSSMKTKAKKAGGKDKPKNVKAHPEEEQLSEKPVKLRCVTCNSEFPTRNKLFDHLKSSGHASALSTNPTATASSSRSKKDKRKNR